MKATIDDERSTWPLRVRGVAYLPAVDLDIGSLNRIMVRDNDVVFGTVNANRWHY
ncbi:MAG: Glucose dehydrogenase C-terminus, partial [Alphaproteobacteria bacterium]|nr:Glucose dehydrogenase C-terminus [Alphaproteobacteria bacterium]